MDEKRYLKGTQNGPVWPENTVFGGLIYLFPSWNMLRNIQDQQRSSYLSLINKKIKLMQIREDH